jgi:hypothetical protein
MKIVEPDATELLTQAHRRWIETRDPKDGDRFAALVAALTKKSELKTAQGKSDG